MDTQELIDTIRRQLDQVEAQGVAQLQISALRSYLVALEANAGESMEARKLNHDGMLAHYNATAMHRNEVLKAVLEASRTALQAVIIINGGAAVALLGAMSAVLGKPGGAQLARYLALPLLEFGVAVFFGALGFAFRYFSQACYGEMSTDDANERKYKPWGDRFHYAAILSAVVGYVLFVFAIANSYLAVIWSFPR